jgi:hypothetical protein
LHCAVDSCDSQATNSVLATNALTLQQLHSTKGAGWRRTRRLPEACPLAHWVTWGLRRVFSPCSSSCESPVDALGSELRAGLLKRGGEEKELLLAAFFGECDAAKERAMRELERKMAAVTLAPSGACLGASL